MLSTISKFSLFILALSFLSVSAPTISFAQSEAEPEETASSSASNEEIARQLGNPDPLERQRAAEELARLAAVDQLRLVSVYRLQEKNERVRLALDWALYRMGKTATLFSIVKNLDSSRHEQAASYLLQLDTPEALYMFLERVNEKTLARLLRVLAKLGDAATLEQIKPYLNSFDEKVADAAQSAAREINYRLSQPQPAVSTRPRKTGNTTEESSPK
jgi:hypothetical protein